MQGRKLTHWGRVTHICVGKLTNIDSDNGLSSERRQAIIWTSVGILLIGPLGTKFSENLFEIVIFSFTEMRLKVSSAKWRPFCLGFNVLIVIQIGRCKLHVSHQCGGLVLDACTCLPFFVDDSTRRVCVVFVFRRWRETQLKRITINIVAFCHMLWSENGVSGSPGYGRKHRFIPNSWCCKYYIIWSSTITKCYRAIACSVITRSRSKQPMFPIAFSDTLVPKKGMFFVISKSYSNKVSTLAKSFKTKKAWINILE